MLSFTDGCNCSREEAHRQLHAQSTVTTKTIFFIFTNIKILPHRKDDLLYHFGQVIEALSPLTLLPATAGNNNSQ